MRLTVLGLIAMLAMPAIAAGQHGSGQRPGSVPPPRDPLPTWAIPSLTPSRDPLPTWAIPPLIGASPVRSLPTIGLPLQPVGLPLPSIGLQQPRDGNRPGRDHWQGGPGRRQRGPTAVGWPVMVFVMPEQAAPAAQHRAPEPPPIEQRSPKGNLVFEVQPGSAQVFVDGYFAGAADDFNGDRRSLPLDAGPHTIVLDEPGYELVNFDVTIASSDAIVYRRVLRRANIPPPARSIVTPPAPIYLIPGCYVGNVPPKDAGLPPTCDPSRAVRLN